MSSDRLRVLLAALLVEAGSPVATGVLAEIVWDGTPPEGAAGTLRSHVMRLRRALGPVLGARVVTRSPGYLIEAGVPEVDLLQFRTWCQETGAAAEAGGWRRAAELAAQALGLWRGRPLLDIPSQALADQEVPRLERLHVAALHWSAEAALHLGQHAQVLPRLEELARRYRLDERFCACLMLALYRCGRQADALNSYRTARAVLADELGVDPGPELERLHQQILTADPALAEPGQPLVSGARTRPATGALQLAASAYRGLGAYREQDAAFFFGRESATAEVLRRIGQCLAKTGIMVVSGVSGAGKSSLLHAGVIPALRTRGLPGVPGSDTWPYLVFTPGKAPLNELAVQVAPAAGADAATIRNALSVDPSGFALIARQLALAHNRGTQDQQTGQHHRLLVIVDQFEQVFTLCRDEAQSLAFITALHAAATAGPGEEPAAVVVAAVRADFEARCASCPQLTDAVQDRYLLTAMTQRQLRQAITGPAAKAGSSVEADLVETLLQEVNSHQASPAGPGTIAAVSAGVLPLLSHALDQAWRHRAGQALTLGDYDRTGGIETAVAASAQQAYDRLTPAQQATAKLVFTRLIATSSDGVDTAEPATRAELTAGTTAAQARDIGAAIEAFAAQRLLTLAADTVEISHEVLLTAWPLLADTWLAESQTDRITRTRLRHSAADWDRHHRDTSYLYTGNLLAMAAEAAARADASPARHLALAGTERAFLHASSRAQRHRAWLRQGVIAVLMTLVLTLTAVTFTAIHAGQEAVRQRDMAIADQLASTSESTGNTNPVLARRESLAAWSLYPSSQTRFAMYTADALPGIATFNSPGPLESVAFSPGGRTLVTASQGAVVNLRNTRAPFRSSQWNIGRSPYIKSPAFSPDSRISLTVIPGGEVLAAVMSGGGVQLWNVATHRPDGQPFSIQGGLDSVAFSPDGKIIAGGDGNGSVQLWNVATHHQIGGRLHLSQCVIAALAFSPDSKRLAVACDSSRNHVSGRVLLYDVSNHHRVGATPAVPSGITSVSYSPTGGYIAFSNESGQAWLWNIGIIQHHPVRLLSSSESGGKPGQSSVAFSPDGQILATGSPDGIVRLWNVAAQREIGTQLSMGGDGIESMAFSPSGAVLATGNGAGTAELWSTTAANRLQPGSLPGGTTLMFSPDGNTLAVGNVDENLAARFNTITHQQIGAPLRFSKQTIEAAFSPDGKFLATISSEETQLWDIATHRRIEDALPRDQFLSLAFSPDSKLLAYPGSSGSFIWQWGTVSLQWAHIPVNGGQASSVAYSPDGHTLAEGGIGKVFLRNLITGRQTSISIAGDARSSAVYSMVFSPDGKALAVFAGDTLVLCDLVTHSVSAVPGAGEVDSVAFAPGGQIMITGDSDGTVQLRDMATGQQIGPSLTPPGSSAVISSVAVSPNGDTLATASNGGTWLWHLPNLTNAGPDLCAAAGPFTQAQWARQAPGTPYRNTCPPGSPHIDGHR